MYIVGLGNAGCQIAKNFEKHAQYRVICIDTKNQGYNTFCPIREEKSHQDYEKKYKKINLPNIEDPVTLILSGAGKISGCVLRLLEQLKKNTVNIVYIKPDELELSNKFYTRDKITFSVLQQYARSALINKIYIFSNKNTETILGDQLSLKNYWQDINEAIANTLHMFNIFSNTEPVLTTTTDPHETARIATLGVLNFDTNREKLFYDIEHPRSKLYYYGITDNTLTENKEILQKIRKFVTSQSSENTNTGFSIYATNYEYNYAYSVHYASYIQEQEIK